MNFNYQATGTLKAHFELTDTKSIILVERVGGLGLEYVVSFYFQGRSEWESGQYFASYQEATAEFENRIDSSLV